jgi:aminopeptidase N
MWIHESFTAYFESLFLNYHYSKNASTDYIIGTRQKILNDMPIIGSYNVNKPGSVDMYYKGANMLHTLRQLIKNDSLWRETLRGLNKDFYHKTVSTKQIEDYISKKTGIDLSAFFNQYLRDTRIPVLTYIINDKKLYFKWDQTVYKFDMPVQVSINGEKQWIYPKNNFTQIELINPIKSFNISADFYVAELNLNRRKKN